MEYLLLKLQRNSDITNSVINKHQVITNRLLSQIGHFSTQINPVIPNPGYNKHGHNEQKMIGPEIDLFYT